VRIRDLSEQEAEEISRRHGIREGFGALVVEVMKDTPAEGAGLRAGDLVVDIRGRPIVDTRTLQRAVAAAPVGEVLPLVVLRSNEGRRAVRVRLGQMPDDVVASRIAMEFGFFVREPEAQPEVGGRRLSTAPTLAAIVPGSSAAAAGLRSGDVLVEVAGRGVLTLDAALGALREVRLDRPLPLVVRRGGENLTVTVDPPRP
jgi:serine protease Do